MKTIQIFDTTLRDGAQCEGISFSVSDKLEIVKTLDDFGITYIEAGNPVSNPKDAKFFSEVKRLNLKHSKLVAFGSTRRKYVNIEDDENIKALLNADTPVISIFGKAWDLNVKQILKVSLEENLRLVGDTIKHLKSKNKEVIFDAEHFFDGYVHNKSYAIKVIQTAIVNGADTVVLCDTNGGSSPIDVYNTTKEVCTLFKNIPIGIHCHNDIGCAIANSGLAVEAGATHVQGTFTGIGERCGNTDLSVLIPNLQLKKGYQCVTSSLTSLTDTVIKISEITNMSVPSNKPYVGSSAFAHKGGMHIDGVAKNSMTFEHISPSDVGNNRRFLLSEVSGKNAVLLRLSQIDPSITKDSKETAIILNSLKKLEHEGYQFEAADASFEILVKKLLGKFKSHFTLDMYKTSGEYPSLSDKQTASAMLKITVGDTTEITADLGNGPINALDLALRKALVVFYPKLKDVYLVDYKVRVLEAKNATGSTVRVLIDSTDGKRKWTTIGVSEDIIAASWSALVDSIEYALMD